VDSNGNVSVVGRATGKGFGLSWNWCVRRSTGGTGAWQTVDAFQYLTNTASEALGVVGDASGHVFVAGYGQDASRQYHWLLRKN